MNPRRKSVLERKWQTDRLLAARPEEVRTLCERIEVAFRDVTLGDGIGLWEAQGLDDYADAATMAAYKRRDLRDDWHGLAAADLEACYSSLCFFDSAGMHFHLPAFLIAELLGTYRQGIYCLEGPNFDQFALVSREQRAAVAAYLEYVEKLGGGSRAVKRALEQYWRVSNPKG